MRSPSSSSAKTRAAPRLLWLRALLSFLALPGMVAGVLPAALS